MNYINAGRGQLSQLRREEGKPGSARSPDASVGPGAHLRYKFDLWERQRQGIRLRDRRMTANRCRRSSRLVGGARAQQEKAGVHVEKCKAAAAPSSLGVYSGVRGGRRSYGEAAALQSLCLICPC